MTKFIGINGPRGCGKTVARDYMLDTLLNLVEPVSFKDKLHVLTQEFFCVSPDEYWSIYNDRSRKEVPQECFSVSVAAFYKLDKILKISFEEKGEQFKRRFTIGSDKVRLSIREAMIYVSEVVCKPTFGKSYFGQAVSLKLTENKTYIDESTAFVEELEPLIEKIGQENILLIRVKGRGDFSGDSRSFIPDGVIKNTVDIWNTESENKYMAEISSIMTKFILNK